MGLRGGVLPRGRRAGRLDRPGGGYTEGEREPRAPRAAPNYPVTGSGITALSLSGALMKRVGSLEEGTSTVLFRRPEPGADIAAAAARKPTTPTMCATRRHPPNRIDGPSSSHWRIRRRMSWTINWISAAASARLS